MTDSSGGIAASYDAVADEYLARFGDELDRKPADRELLDTIAVELAGRGPVCDVGCGPGHVTRYLADRGVDAFGLDLSAAMVRLAGERNPDLEFVVGDARALDFPDDAWAGAIAFYSIFHLPRAELPMALNELRRVIRPGGPLVASFHRGEGEVHTDEFLGRPVSVSGSLYTVGELTVIFESTGFTIERAVERPPYEGEGTTHRIYLTARA